MLFGKQLITVSFSVGINMRKREHKCAVYPRQRSNVYLVTLQQTTEKWAIKLFSHFKANLVLKVTTSDATVHCKYSDTTFALLAIL